MRAFICFSTYSTTGQGRGFIERRRDRRNAGQPQNHIVARVFPDICEHQHHHGPPAVQPADRRCSHGLQQPVEQAVLMEYDLPEQHHGRHRDRHGDEERGLENAALFLKRIHQQRQQEGKGQQNGEAYLIAGSYPHESIYMLQHVFNNWFTKLDIDKMCTGAVLMALVVIALIGVLQLVWGRGGQRPRPQARRWRSDRPR